MHAPEHPAVVYSSLAYCIVGSTLIHTPLLAALMWSSGIAAYCHHQRPRHACLRALDWVCALALVLYFALHIPPLPSMYVLATGLTALWGISAAAFHTKRMYLYTVTHTLWHVASAVFVGVVL